MVTSSERRQLESWYLDPPQAPARCEKCAAGLVLVFAFFGLEPFLATSYELRGVEMAPLPHALQTSHGGQRQALIDGEPL
jgi:hypothetical protein